MLQREGEGLVVGYVPYSGMDLFTVCKSMQTVCRCVCCVISIHASSLLSLHNSGLSNGARYQEFYPYKTLEGPH